jgi:hypothetical protein
LAALQLAQRLPEKFIAFKKYGTCYKTLEAFSRL